MTTQNPVQLSWKDVKILLEIQPNCFTYMYEVAEWLRRWTANPLGSARVGSNPIGVVIYVLRILLYVYAYLYLLQDSEIFYCDFKS